MNVREKSLKELSEELNEFVEARGWRGKDPSRLMLSLVAEVGELSEVVNKTNSFEVDENIRKEIAFEMVDVLNFLMRLGREYGINLMEAWDEKMPLLAEKYPVGIDREKASLRKEEYRRSGRNKLYQN